MKLVVSAVVAAGLFFASPGFVGASPSKGERELELAGMALDELDYAEASKHLSRALRAGDHSPASLAEVHRLSGQVAAAFGKADAAYEHYRRMLAIAPDGRLPKGLAPKLVAPFERARAFMADRALRMRVRERSSRRVVVQVAPDPLHLAAAVRAEFRRGGRSMTVRARLYAGRARVPVPAGVDRLARIAAVDAHGNSLVAIEVSLQQPEPRRIVRRPQLQVNHSVASKPPRSRPLYARWYTWGLAAAAGAAVSVYYGVQAMDDWERLDAVIADSNQHSFQTAYDLEVSGRRNQLYSNIAAGVSVGLAGIAGYLLLRGGDSDEKPGKLVAAPVLTSHGASVALTGSF